MAKLCVLYVYYEIWVFEKYPTASQFIDSLGYFYYNEIINCKLASLFQPEDTFFYGKNQCDFLGKLTP